MRASNVWRLEWRAGCCISTTCFCLATAGLTRADTNVWIKGVSGVWEETNSWSLGVLPDSSQSIRIDGSWLAVAINPNTRQEYPEALTVSDLTIGGSNTTLLLNWFGKNIPLTVFNGLTISGHDPTNRAELICLQSGLSIKNGPLWVTGNGQIAQDGGFIRISNGTTFFNGLFYLTNGLFEADSVQFGSAPTNYYSEGIGSFYQYGAVANLTNLCLGSITPGSTFSIYDGELNVSGSVAVGEIEAAHFYQYGGSVKTGRLAIDGWYGGDDYNLRAGELVVTGALTIAGEYGGNGLLQQGGTNRSGELRISPVSGYVSYTLNAGLLCTSNVVLEAPGEEEPVFSQNGGIHLVANTISLLGAENHYSGLNPACYYLLGGSVSARALDLQSSVLVVSNGAATISGTLQLRGLVDGYGFSQVQFFSGGKLTCLNTIYEGSGSDINQTGGEFIVTNLFSYGGHNNWYGARFAEYDFSDGTLYASNIELSAKWIIGSTAQARRITNPGYFKMAGTLEVGDAVEQLGRFILASNAVLDLGDGNANLSFANSSAETWNSVAILVITNWGGSPNGGGVDQLKFGNNGSGLAARQVSQIRFVNPMRFVPGTYLAQILPSGEMVPALRPTVLFSWSGTNLIFRWPSDFILQTATNLRGPYEDVPAASPYTNILALTPQGYFRLRH